MSGFKKIIYNRNKETLKHAFFRIILQVLVTIFKYFLFYRQKIYL